MAPPSTADSHAATIERVTVEKYYEPATYSLPVIVYRFVSRQNRPVTFTLRDRVPDSVSFEDVRLHRDRYVDIWCRDGDRLVATCMLDPGEVFKTFVAFSKPPAIHPSTTMPRPKSIEVEPASSEPTPHEPPNHSAPYDPYLTRDNRGA